MRQFHKPYKHPSSPRRRGSVRPGVFRVGRVRVPVEARSGPRSRRLLRRWEAGWGAIGGERPVRRIRTRFGRVPRRAGGFTAKPIDGLSREGTPSSKVAVAPEPKSDHGEGGGTRCLGTEWSEGTER